MATSCTQKPTLQSNSTEANRFMDKLMTKIFCFYDKQSLIDVTFKFSNSTTVIPAHRLILAAASPYFENLFNGEQGNNPVIEITDIDSEIFESLIVFCYTGQTLITVKNVGAMVKAAIVLQLDDAITSCVDYLMTHIGEYTLQSAYTLERETQCELLKQTIIEYEIQNFIKISQSNEFLNFDVEKMQRLLESDNLNIAREEDAYDAIKRWFNYDVPARQEQLPLLIACLRLLQFDADFLFTHIEPLPGCELLAYKALLWTSKPEVRTKINMRFTEPRAISSTNFVEKTILAVCSSTNLKLLQYNKVEDKWQEYVTIKYKYQWYRTILKDDNLLFIGGNKKGESVNIVRSWNIRNKTWQDLPVMNQARDEHCVVELDGKIYAIGGSEGDNALSSVERYTTSDGWKFVNSMNVRRFQASAVSLNGKIYIMGGYNGNNCLQSIECYNPDTNAWTYCTKMSEFHTDPATAVHNGHIYVLSNKSDNCLVERYNPQQDTWSKICSLKISGELLAGVSLENKLWVIGGISAGKICLSVYDEENDDWRQKCSLPQTDLDSCFVVPEVLLASK